MLKTVSVLDYQIAVIGLVDAAKVCLELCLKQESKEAQLVVTLNPEIIIQAEHSSDLKQALQAAYLTVADGVGVVWAAKQFGHTLPERVAGVELTMKLLELGSSDLRVFFLGAKEGVAERAAQEAHKRFGTSVAGVHHGYFDKQNADDVCQLIANSNADLLLAALGEGQELFLFQNKHKLNSNVMMGVGGTLDVLSGEVKRTPLWTRKMRLEWAYRVGLDRKRWHRFPRLLAFVRLVLSKK